MYLQCEERENGIWRYVPGDVYDGRVYVVFAQLAGVRNNEYLTPIAQPRGLPAGPDACSPEVLALKFDETTPEQDRRITSWLTLRELETIDWAAFSTQWMETDFSIGVMSVLRRQAQGKSADDVRIVFWFDDKEEEQRVA